MYCALATLGNYGTFFEVQQLKRLLVLTLGVADEQSLTALSGQENAPVPCDTQCQKVSRASCTPKAQKNTLTPPISDS